MSEKRIPARRVPPGRILSRELEARGWSQKDLATIMGRPEQAISEIVTGKKEVTPETAIQLGEAFGTSAELWMNLEANYRLWLANKAEQDTAIERRRRLYTLAPVSELAKLGWITEPGGIDELEKEVCDFLGIRSPDETPNCAVSLRRSRVRGPEAANLTCWVKRVENLVATQQVGAFDRGGLKKAIPRILEHAAKAEDVVSVPPLLLSLGIRFVMVPHLSNTYLDGAMFRLGRNPVVALTLRYSRIDSFWFSLMHELAHLVAGHKGDFLDTIYGRDKKAVGKEAEADRMAQDWLVDSTAYRSFVRETQPYFSGPKIRRFAETQGRHPGIVLGRLHFDRKVDYKNLRSLLVNVKPFLEPWFDRPVAA